MKKFFLDKKFDGFLDKLWVKKSVEFFLKSSTFREKMMIDLGGGEQPYKNLFLEKNVLYYSADLHFSPDVNIILDLNKLLPIKNSALDFVVSTQVLEHLENPFFTLSEIYRILNHNGKLFLTVPSFFRLHETPNDFHRFTYYGLNLLFCKAGFSSFKIWGHGDEFSTLAESLNFAISSMRFPRKAVLFFIAVINSIFFIRDKNKHLGSNPEKNYIGLSAIANK